MNPANPFGSLREEMDKHVVGHDEVKTALLLGIISREHIYIEGPPGTAKTMLSEIVSKAAQLNFFFYQLHRDTRLSELVGDLTIVKEETELGERIKQDIVKGGILTSEICLLDDISRAPGESLNILLRILNERKFFNEPIPLLTAIATSNPTADEYYNEPLDPANLDRFVLQVKALGISYGKKWDEARKVIELYSERPFEEKIPKRVSKKIFDRSYKALEKIQIPPDVQEGLANFAAIMIEDCGLNETNSLISDRTFFVKALKLIRSHALLNERDVCSKEDLAVLKYMTAFRVPPDVYEQMDKILRDIVQDKKKKPDDKLTPDPDQMPDSEFDQDFSEEPKGEIPDEEADKETENPLAEAQKTFFDALRDLKQNLDNNQSEMAPPEGQDVPSDPTGNPQDSGNTEREDKSARAYMSSKSSKAGEDDDTVIPGRGNTETAENIKRIMRVLEGNFQKSMARKTSHPGGSPRKWKRMSSFDEIEDIDPVEAFIWSEHTSPRLPRVHLREKEMLGGEVAILRDISTSMMGLYSEWSSSVVKGVIELARKKRMRIGYLEFNHRSKKHTKNSRFFTRNYSWIEGLAEKTDCSGNTNYERALEEALKEFRSRGLRNKHILFITDGIPTSGDPEVEAQRERAKSIGVCIHSIFIGSKNYPAILEKISKETVGTQFMASKGRDDIIRIERKDRAYLQAEQEKIAKSQLDGFAKAFRGEF